MGQITKAYSIVAHPTTLLVSPNGREMKRWDGFTSAIKIGLRLRNLLGSPSGTAEIRGVAAEQIREAGE
jgi:hypothetical protein